MHLASLTPASQFLLQEASDYDFLELVTDLVYILSVLQAPTDLKAIIAHDYGAAADCRSMSALQRFCLTVPPLCLAPDGLCILLVLTRLIWLSSESCCSLVQALRWAPS